MRTHPTSSLPPKRPMIVFPIAVLAIVLCGIAATMAPQPGSHVNRVAVPHAPDQPADGSDVDAPLAQVDLPAAR